MRVRRALTALSVAAALIIPTTGAAAQSAVKWSESALPTTGTVTVPAGQTVILDTNLDVTGLIINGTLRCGNRNLRIEARYILVNGTFRCGTHQNRYDKRLTITLRGSGHGDYHGYGDKYLVVAGGSLSFHGEDRVAWTRLTATASRNATSIHVANHDWRVGDDIVIASTDFNGEQAEQLRITAVNGNRLTLDRPLDYMHYCGTETYRERSVTECAEVGLLKRNITVRGSLASEETMLGGHAMFASGSRIRIEGAEFRRMGQVGQLGRYPVHFHLFGDATGSFFNKNSIWESYNRWVTLHGVQNLRVNRNVGFDTLGHGFYFEDGNEVGNRVVGNLGVLVREGVAGNLTTPSDSDAAVFWITNPDNYIVGNVAAGAPHSGFWYALPEHPLGPSYDPTIWPRQTPLDTFHNNTAHSVGFAGLYVDGGERPDRQTETVWYNPRAVPGDNESAHVRPTFTKFTSYKSRHYGMWVRTFSGAVFRNNAFANNWRSIYLANIRSGPNNDNVGIIRESLMVGETANMGQPESWENTGAGGRSLPQPWNPNIAIGGVPFYDGPMEVRQVVFANFKPNSQRNAGAITSLFPNAFWISPENAVYAVKFVNSKKVLLPKVTEYVDGDATSMFIDVGGRVTGTPGAAVVVRGALLDDATCTARPAWRAKQCDLGHMSLSLHRHDGKWARVELQRSDGRSFGHDGSSETDTSVYFTLVTGKRHTLSWQAGAPNAFDLWIAGVSPAAEGKAARIAFPAPGGNWTFQVNGEYDPVAKLSDLQSGPSAWFYESSTNLIHVRLVGQNWVTLRS